MIHLVGCNNANFGNITDTAYSVRNINSQTISYIVWKQVKCSCDCWILKMNPPQDWRFWNQAFCCNIISLSCSSQSLHLHKVLTVAYEHQLKTSWKPFSYQQSAQIFYSNVLLILSFNRGNWEFSETYFLKASSNDIAFWAIFVLQ